MAFTTIPDSIIQVGKSITRTLFKTYVKDSLDDLNTRLLDVEAAAGKIIVFDEIVLNAASLTDGGTVTGLDLFRAPNDFTLLDAKVFIFETGTLTGNLELDVKKASSSDFTSAVSVFTTKPKIDYSTANDYDESSNAVFDNTEKDILAGEYLRLDVSELPTGNIGKFGVYLIGEVS